MRGAGNSQLEHAFQENINHGRLFAHLHSVAGSGECCTGDSLMDLVCMPNIKLCQISRCPCMQ